MAKLKDLRRILDKQLKDVAKELQNGRFIRELGIRTKVDIQRRIRLGYGVSRDGAGKVKLKSLSESYKLQRRNKLTFWTRPDGTVVPVLDTKSNRAYLSANKIKLASSTSPAKSNLTRTGDMIKSMRVRSSKGKFTIYFSTADNVKKAEYVSKDRPFMFVTRQELRRLRKLVTVKAGKVLRARVNF